MQIQTKNSLFMILGIATVLGAGVVHGIQGDRWGNSESLDKAAKRLDNIPKSFGNWSSEATQITERELKIAEAVGHFNRRYSNTKTNQVVSVMILCGKPGPISVHPPTVCFVGAGWGLESDPKVVNNDSGDASFWNGRFVRSQDGRRIVMSTKWGWSDSSSWSAFDNPRLETAGAPFLYKMYISTLVDPLQTSEDVGSRQEFVDEFLPLVQKALFEDQKNG